MHEPECGWEAFDKWLAEKGGRDALDAEQLQLAKQIGLTMDEAIEIASRYSEEEILAMAKRGFEHPESQTAEDVRVILANNLVRIGNSRPN